ncbi:hypothetical protein BJX96DRAFT_124578 [Aspergillus floccosus]
MEPRDNNILYILPEVAKSMGDSSPGVNPHRRAALYSTSSGVQQQARDQNLRCHLGKRSGSKHKLFWKTLNLPTCQFVYWGLSPNHRERIAEFLDIECCFDGFNLVLRKQRVSRELSAGPSMLLMGSLTLRTIWLTLSGLPEECFVAPSSSTRL